MLIEQNVELELKDPGPRGRTCTPMTDRKLFEWIIKLIYYQKIARGNVPYFHLSRPNKSLTIKIRRQIARFLTFFGLKLQVRGGLNNLIFSIGFQMLKILFFQVALNTCEMHRWAQVR